MSNTISLNLTRFAISFAFLYVAIDMHIHTENWLSYFPSFLFEITSSGTLVWLSSIFHIVIALWLAFGRRIFMPALISTVFLTGIVVMNWSGMEILFRDISLIIVCIALMIEGWDHEVWGLGSRSWTHHPDFK